jgi:pimeloyl-ACP methyl ester carboxylesterase
MAHDLASLWSTPPSYADVGTARIAWRQVGSGSPLLLVHGWPLTSFSFRRVLPRLAEHFTCILPDTPGLGETEWTERSDFRFPGQANTLRRFADSLDLGTFSVLAFDTGATIARELALADPRRVKKLVLLNTEIPHHRPPFIRLFQRTFRLPGAHLGMRTLLRTRALRRSAIGFGGCFADLSLLDGDFHAGMVEPLMGSPRRIEGARRYLLGVDWSLVDGLAQRHREIAAPVLLVWGAEDPTFPLARARELPGQFADCKGLVAVPGAKLLVHEEKPAEVVDAALPFLVG